MNFQQLLIMFSNFVLLVFGIALSIPVIVLFVECISALFSIESSQQNEDTCYISRPNVAVLVPAHNEATGIEIVLINLLQQIQDSDRLIVIADNCSDNTAEKARDCGATVIERNNQNFKGKGYALDFGINFLKSEPPDVVLMVDADCIVQEGLIDKVARLVMSTGKPVQSLYLLDRQVEKSYKSIISMFAFTLKNLVRPLGLKHLKLPCFLTGSGMAFSWLTINKISLASSNLVEDMQLTIDLAIAGHTAIFCPSAKLLGSLPEKETAKKSQRTRWEHGHLKTILTQVPRLVKAAIAQKRIDLLALSLDLSVPPISLLAIFWSLATVASILYGSLSSQWEAFVIFIMQGLLIFISVFVAWIKFGRNNISLRTLVSMPFYIFWKLPIYLSFLIKPQTRWIRTERKK